MLEDFGCLVLVSFTPMVRSIDQMLFSQLRCVFECYPQMFNGFAQVVSYLAVRRSVSVQVHGIQPTDARIRNASPIVDVWGRFVAFS